MLESLLGGLFGGLFRLAPEVLKWLDRKDERAHELDMFDRNMQFERLKGDITLEQGFQTLQGHELDAMAQAFKEQAATAKAAGAFVAGLSALVRPTVTYYFCALYGAVKAAIMLRAYQMNADWQSVFITCWSQDDTAIFSMILTFWFVGRCFESKIHKTRN